MIDNRKDSKPDVLTAAKHTSTSGMNQDGNAAYVHDITADLATIAAAQIRIADELSLLNRFLSVTRHDDTDCAGLARIIYEKWRLGGCR